MVTPASVPIVTYLIELSGQVPIPASSHGKPSCCRHAKKLSAIVRARREHRAGRWPQKTARNKSRTPTAAIDVVGTMVPKHIILLICYVVVACCLTCITGRCNGGNISPLQ